MGKTMRRNILVAAAQLAVIFLIMVSLYLGRHQLAQVPRPSFLPDHRPTKTSNTITSFNTTNDAPIRAFASSKGTAYAGNITAYVKAIMYPNAVKFPRLECPRPQLSRYEGLKLPQSNNSTSYTPYFFALDLRDNLPLLPRLLGSVVEAIRFLGPKNCALSVVEGNSADGTAEVLAALRPELDGLTTTYYFRSSDINPKEGDRIAKLAELRNMALKPLITGSEAKHFSANTTVIFLNDVAICMEDILELVHQRRSLGADMTCAFDWTYVGRDPTFYDVWVARGMNGDSFFHIPPDGNWNSAWDLFWNDIDAQDRFLTHKPIQVFSCWNGAVAFTARPIVERKVAFRGPQPGECAQGEPQLFCKDMWSHGFGKIAALPSISLGYSNEDGKRLKRLKGYTSQLVSADPRSDAIPWQTEPPERVKCIPSYDNQYFQAWNETLP